MAVLLVLVFHVFPRALPGGYIGVDVFFVISGFLISNLLIRERERTGGINLLVFYERRIRRLLPAATVVLVAGAVGTILFLPQMRWVDTAGQLLASAFYAENWYLYFQATDYLRADELPGPFQHYWSLSIEEQFYMLWPLLILLISGLGRFGVDQDRKRTRSAIYFLALSAVFFSSLYMSVRTTYENQPTAYFVSHTRFWELALGGLTAMLVPYVRMMVWLRFIVLWSAIAAIVYAAWTFDEASPFPGYIALLPTGATALLLLLGGSASKVTTDGLLGLSPVRYIGDISYSLYLWHWPVVIFAMAHLGHSFSLTEGLAVIFGSIAFAIVSKHLVEDWLRHRSKGAGIWRAYAIFLVCSGLSIAAAAGLYIPAKAAQEEAASQIIIDAEYPGATSLYMDIEVPSPEGPAFIPDLSLARQDLPEVYSRGCHVARPDVDPIPCVFEMTPVEEESQKTVMLVGDSHAAHWLPALQEIGATRNWTIITHTKSSCPFIDTSIIVAKTEYPECLVWSAAVREDILSRQPDLLMTAMVTNHFAVGATSQEDNQERLAAGLLRAWQPLKDAEIPIAVVRGTPRMGQLIPECLAENPDTPLNCAVARETALGHGGSVSLAANQAGSDVTIIDITDAFCNSKLCEPIVGNVLVYRDQHHITVAYMKTLARLLEEKLLAIMKVR